MEKLEFQIPPLDSRLWEAAEREQNFWEENYSRLLRCYPDRFVAICEGKVVGRNKDLIKLAQSLKRRNYDIKQVLVRYLTTRPARVML